MPEAIPKNEVVIAKKIEESRVALFSALCESYITADTIASIRDRLNDDIILVKDIINTANEEEVFSSGSWLFFWQSSSSSKV